MRLNNKMKANFNGILPTFNSTITIFNKYTDKKNFTRYIKKQIDLCYWQNKLVEDLSGDTLHQTNSYMVFIPYSPLYLSPKEWLNSDKQSYFTIDKGDLVFLGKIDFEIDETKKGSRANDYLSQYTNSSFKIKTIKDLTTIMNLAPHYEITG